MKHLVRSLLFLVAASMLFTACRKDDYEPDITSEQDGTLRILAFHYYSFLIKPDNTLWAVGEFNDPNSGTGFRRTNKAEMLASWTKIEDNVRSIATNFGVSLMLKTDGTLYTCGHDDINGHGYSKNKFMKLTDNVRKIAAGSYAAYFVKNDHTLWSMGKNEYGQLLDGTFTDLSTPQKVMDNVKDVKGGMGWVMVLKNDGSVWTAGSDFWGALGSSNMEEPQPLKKIADNAVAIESGMITMYLKNDGTLWATGRSSRGMGLEYHTEEGYVKIAENVKKMYCLYNTTYILKHDNSFWGTGNNNNGELGLGHNNSPVMTFTKIADHVTDASIGNDHGFMIKSDGTLWGTGSNLNGQLGLGNDIKETNKFIQIKLPE